jgi:hypothetical protein
MGGQMQKWYAKTYSDDPKSALACGKAFEVQNYQNDLLDKN